MAEQQNIEAFGNCIRHVFIAKEFDKSGIVVGGAGGCGDSKDVPEYIRRAYDVAIEYVEGGGVKWK